MWTFDRQKCSASQRGSRAVRAALVSLGFISIVPFVPACGAQPNAGEEELATSDAEELATSDAEELALDGAEESLVTSDAEDTLDPGASGAELGTLSQALTVHSV